MDSNSIKIKKKRNFSNSPFNISNNYNELNIHKKKHLNQNSFLSDSSMDIEESENTNNFEYFRDIIRKKNDKIRDYLNQINELIFKKEEMNYKCMMYEQLNKNMKIKIDNLQQEIMRKDDIIQKREINDEEITSQAFSNSSKMNSENFEYLEKIYYYEKKIKLLIQKNKELNSEVLKSRKIIIDLNKKNNFLLEKNEKLQKKNPFN